MVIGTRVKALPWGPLSFPNKEPAADRAQGNLSPCQSLSPLAPLCSCS